jgi:acyl-CoA dehydrogenase
MYTGNPDVPDDLFADVLKQIKDFVRTRVVPREVEIMTTDAIPRDVRALAAEMGLFGYAIPQEWGGLGLDLVQDVEVAMELGYTTLAFRSMFGTNNGIAGQVLVNFGTQDQKARWLPGLAAGELVASFALTEPGAGSATAGSSMAASGSSRTRPRPTSSSSSPAPSPRRRPATASPSSWFLPRPTVSRWV